METTSPDIVHEPALLEWSAPGRIQHERTTIWYIGIAIVFGLCLLYSIVTSAWSFTVLLIMFAAFYAYTHRLEPQERHIVLAKDGCRFNGQVFSWKDCEGFYMLQGRGYVELRIAEKTRLHESIIIHLEEGITPSQIREVFAGKLPELHRKEKVLDTIMRICKL